MAKRKKTSLEIINAHAAGIDVGSRSHFVAIGQGKTDVREFGVYSDDLKKLGQWLIQNGVTTVALESTGTYWQNLYASLQGIGLTVTLVNGKFAKNIHGKKTDVKDCQWLQKLHTLGLLTGSFLPNSATEQLRTYFRHRGNLIDTAADTIRKMQKYLRLLNLRLDVVVRDITGETGLLIIEAVCKGETSGEALSLLRHYNCRKSKEEIAKALQTNRREDYLFALTQEFDMYKVLQQKIRECDTAMEQLINQQLRDSSETRELKAEAKPHKRVNKNAPKNIDINQVSYQYFNGVDLMTIEGVSHNLVMTLMSEVGYEGVKKFPTASQFTSWLRLSPNNKISGGRILSNRVPKGSNRLKLALRNTANAVGNLKETHLSNFFKRICFRRGRAAAVSATARKLAVIIWNMIIKRIPYNPPKLYEFLDQKRKRKVQEMRKLIAKFNLSSNDLGLMNS